MSFTISGTYDAGITLTSVADNPVSVSGTIIANDATALTGVGGPGYGWIIDNSGVVFSYAGAGIYLGSAANPVANAMVTNEPGATIAGSTYGVLIDGTGSLTNNAGGVISGSRGVAFQYGIGTLVNAGVIIGSDANLGAVKFAVVDPANRLIAQPGAVFYGYVDGGGGVLELASGVGGGSRLAGIGSGITNISTLAFDPGAQWTVVGASGPAGFDTIDIVGFIAGDTIDVAGFVVDSDGFSNNLLTLTAADTSQITLHIEGSFAAGDFMFADDGAGGSDITVAATGPSPVIAGTQPVQALHDDDTVQPFAVVTVADANSGAVDSISITLLVDGAVSDANGVLSGPGLTQTGAGSYELASATPGDITTELQALVFTPTAHQVTPTNSVSTTLLLSVSDVQSVAPATDANTSVVVTAVNDPPVIAGAQAAQALAADATDQPFAAVSVSDPDVDASETVTITLQVDGAASDANGTLSGDGLSRTDIGTYALAVGTPDQVTAALRALTFTPTLFASGAPRSTTLELSVTDDPADTPVLDATTSVVVAAPNHAPVVAGTLGGQALRADATDHPFASAAISDADADAVETVTVTLLAGGLATDANGILSGGGLSRSGVGTYVLTVGTPSEVTAALQALTFTPTLVRSGAPRTTNMKLSVSDGNVASPVVDTATDVVVTAANNPPTIAGTKHDQTLRSDASDQPFAAVTLSDPDPGANETLTVRLLVNGSASDANGTLSGDDLSTTGSGTYVLAAGTPDAVTAELRALTFNPASVSAGASHSTTMELSVSDSIVAVPVSDTTTSVITIARPVAPSINGTLSGQTAVIGGGAVAPFSAVSVSDADAGGAGTDTLTITLSDPTLGSLEDLGGGSFDAGTGVYSFSGTPDAITAVLRSLTFSPAPSADGFVTTTGFTLHLTGSGGSISDSSTGLTTVQQVLGFASVPASQFSIALSPGGEGFVGPQPGLINEAVVTAPAPDGTYTVPTGYQAEFLGGAAGASLTDESVGNVVLIGNNGNDSIVATAGNDSIVAGNGNDTLRGGPGNVVIMAGGGDDLVTSGSASNFSIAGGAGNDTISGSGSGTILGGAGSNQLFGGSGATITSAGMQDTVAGLGGALTAQASGDDALLFGTATGNDGSLGAMISGAQATVSAGQASASVTTSGSGALIFGGFGSVSGGLSVVDNGSDTTISGGQGTTALSLNGSSALAFGSFGDAVTLTVVDNGHGDTISAGNSAAVVTAGSGSDGLLVFGGSNTLNFSGGAGAATIVAGAGATTVNGGGGSATLFGAAGNVTQLDGDGTALYIAGAGDETLNAGGFSGNLELVGGSGANAITGGDGNDTIFAGAGPATLAGGAGSDLFAFVSGMTHGGADVILDFDANDQVALMGYGADEAAIILNLAVSSAGNTTIALADDTRITFLNVADARALQGHLISA